MFLKFFFTFISLKYVLGIRTTFPFSKLSLKFYQSLTIFHCYQYYVSSQIQLLQKSTKFSQFQKKFSITSAKLLFKFVCRIFVRFLQNYPPVSWKITNKLNFSEFSRNLFIVHIFEQLSSVFQKLFQNFPNFLKKFIKFTRNLSIVSLTLVPWYTLEEERQHQTEVVRALHLLRQVWITHVCMLTTNRTPVKTSQLVASL